MVNKLPKNNHTNVKYLVKFLAKLSAKSDVNKMTPGNIAIVFGPNLLWSHSEDDGWVVHYKCISPYQRQAFSSPHSNSLTANSVCVQSYVITVCSNYSPQGITIVTTIYLTLGSTQGAYILTTICAPCFCLTIWASG